MKYITRIKLLKLPLLLSLAYAFLPSLRVVGVTLSIADLILIFFLFIQIVPSSQYRFYTLRNPLVKHFFLFLIISLFTFLISSIINGSFNYFNSLLILIRPFLFLSFLHIYFSDQEPLSKNDYFVFLIVATVLLIVFSLIVLINIGFQISADYIWSYSPFTRLVGLRGVILGGDGNFAGNDSVNYSLFVCLISLMYFASASDNDKPLIKFLFIFMGAFVSILSSLCLSKSSYVFLAFLFLC